MKIPFWDRISFRQARSVVLLGLAFGVIATAIQIWTDIPRARHSEGVYVEQLMRMVSSSASDAAYELDHKNAKLVTDGLLRYPILKKVDIIDDFGSVIATSEQEETGRSPGWMGNIFHGSGERPVTILLYHGPEKRFVGQMEAYIDENSMVRGLLLRTRAAAVTGIFYIVILAAALLLYFYRSFTDPMQRIIQPVSEFDLSRPSSIEIEVPPRHAKDEIGLLTTTLNRMMGRIRSQRDDICEKEELYRTLFESAPDGICLFGLDLKLVKANRIAVEMLGHKNERSMDAMPLQDIACEDDRARLITDALCINKGEGFKKIDYCGMRKDGASFACEGSLAPVRGAKGDPIAILVILRDVSERKRLENIKDDFIEMVSHELKTPLAILNEGIGLIQDGSVGQISSEQEEILSLVKRSISRLNKLISNVLGFQKFRSGKMELSFGKCNINDIINQACVGLIILTQKHGLKFAVELNSNLPPVNADKDAITEVLFNLVDNAIKFTEKGSITITSGIEAGFILIKISDTGIGIKNEDLPKLFGKFAQIKRKAGGVGLGLLLSKQLIEAHGGRLAIGSVFEKGTTVSVYLPVSEMEV
jgi:two-component system phosphate regulon sensor histidine kinase PhoR